MKGVNLEKELQTQRTKLRAENETEVLNAFKQLYQAETEKEQQILANIFGSDGSIDLLDTTKLDPNKIYGVDEIKKICVDYRLRFLDGSYFKGEIPFEAISKIKALQKNQQTEIKGLKSLHRPPCLI